MKSSIKSLSIILCKNLWRPGAQLPGLKPFWSFPAKIRSSLGVRRRRTKFLDALNFESKRAAAGESELTPHQRLLAVLEYTDAPDQDGLYKYAVSGIRQENG